MSDENTNISSAQKDSDMQHEEASVNSVVEKPILRSRKRRTTNTHDTIPPLKFVKIESTDINTDDLTMSDTPITSNENNITPPNNEGDSNETINNNLSGVGDIDQVNFPPEILTNLETADDVSYEELYCDPPKYCTLENGDEIYAKSKDGNEKFLMDANGQEKYAIRKINQEMQHVPAKTNLGIEKYIRDKDTGLDILPFNFSTQRYILQINQQNGKPIYPIDPNTNESYYPKLPDGVEVYGTDKDGNEFPLTTKTGEQLYAKDQMRNEIYPRNKNRDEYYITRENKEIFAIKRNGDSYYAQKHNGDQFYPRLFIVDIPLVRNSRAKRIIE